MPVERRRICEDPERIFIEHAFFVNDFQNNLTAGRVGETPVGCGGTRVDIVDVNRLYSLYDVINALATSEDIGDKLKVRNARFFQRRTIIFVFSISRKIEKPCGKPLLVQSLHDEFRLLYGETHITILSGESSTLLPSRSDRIPYVIPRNHDITIVIVVHGPFDCSSRHHTSVRSLERDARAGESTRSECHRGRYGQQSG